MTALPRWLPEDHRHRGDTVNRVRADITAHAGSTSREVADRCEVTPLQASRALCYLRDTMREVHAVAVSGGGYRWALVGVHIDPASRPPLSRETAARARALEAKRAKRADRMATLLERLASGPHTRRELADALRWPPRRVEHLLLLLAREGRAANREVWGLAGKWVAL